MDATKTIKKTIRRQKIRKKIMTMMTGVEDCSNLSLKICKAGFREEGPYPPIEDPINLKLQHFISLILVS
jgi:hypothetical protein